MLEQANLVLLEIEETMTKTIESLSRELSSIRTGRANPAILDRITIDYYGAETPLKQIAAISVVEGTQLLISPFDKSTVKAIEQAIYASDLGVNPQSDSAGIRIILPALNEERRKQLSKDVEKKGEESKVAIRNIRREGNDKVKKLALSEDLEKTQLDEVQKTTDKFTKQVDEVVANKIKEIMTI